MTLEEVIKKIKSLEIQGAENIAIAAVKAFGEVLKSGGNLKDAIESLKNARPTEPALRNALNYCLKYYKEDPNVAETVINHFEASKLKIVEFGSKKIKDGMTVFTHCHSGTVVAILKKAFSEGKKFEVLCTETRPRYQGRITAEELAKAGIPVTLSVDSAARISLQKADIFLFGADAITAEGNVINKIGTTLFTEFAYQYQIPVYACTNSWKFSPETIYGKEEEIEERSPKEVWENAPKGVKIINPAFEMTSADKITGVITELGIFKPETLVVEIQKTYPWLITPGVQHRVL